MSFFGAIGRGLKRVGGELLGGVTDLVGNVVGNAQSASQARDMQKRNAAEATINRDFQERMANTAYQRKVADLKAAGMNPALAYESGGAIAPAGNIASGSPAHAESPTRGVVNSALTAAQVKNELATGEAERDKLRADAAFADAQRRRTDLLAPAEFAETTSRGRGHEGQLRYVNVLGGLEDAYFQFRRDLLLSETGRNMASAREINTLLPSRQKLMENELPMSEAFAKFYRGKFGKDISPYLNSARDAGAIFRDLAIPFLLGGRRGPRGGEDPMGGAKGGYSTTP